MWIIGIAQHTPAWVWGLFTALIALGLAQTREREMSLARVTLLPLAMLALSASGVLNAFGHAPWAVGGWLAGLAAALRLGGPWLATRGAVWRTSTGRLLVPGSWLPLALIVLLFALKYAAGASLALHPDLAADARFAGAFALGYGVFSGLFLARALGLRRLATAAPVVA
ncbi:MAG TPA: DUF6622 family protein [Burkholderiaceae bacterium]|nr:DUF6622 family protein [Burkholderiaceae bacterium]